MAYGIGEIERIIVGEEDGRMEREAEGLKEQVEW